MEVPRGFTRCDDPHHDRKSLEKVWLPPCPSCSGSGLVPTEKLREEVAAVLHDTDPRGEGYIEPYRFQADAVLRKVAEHIGEGR